MYRCVIMQSPATRVGCQKSGNVDCKVPASFHWRATSPLIIPPEGSGKYLLLVEAIGQNGRFFRSWTADRLDGEWKPHQDTPSASFASINNVTGAEWSNDGISHGEMLRTNPDETMTVSTCDMKFLFQGRTAAGSEYNLHEYSLGVLLDDRPKPEDATR